MLREEEERAERAEKAKAASHSGASRDVRGDASRRRSDARSALRTHPEETLDDPANAEFLQDMAQGVVPRELEAGAKGPVNVSLVDKRGEDYEKPPEPSYVAYSGAGQTVG